ncbi:MFS transporter [Halobacillus faecis]|uniref:MFS transporter n=1 Tax=Halobacillus faecis TaxID=360184 RepID=A0A511WTH1_9BACI|nr:MFS transporter [Halobacillus faecis]GEN52602.1 MFS transporter [Halobacillus faecis]
MKAYLHQFPKIVWIQTAGHAVTSFVSIILLPFLTLYMYDQFGNNILLATLVIGVQPLTEILFTFLFGGWIDKAGRRAVQLGSLVIQVVAVAGFAFSDQMGVFIFFAFLNGLGRFAYIPAARAQISETVAIERQSETFALLSTASSIGALGGPVIGAVLFYHDPRSLFFLLSGVLLVYLLTGLKWLPESNLRVKSNEPVPRLNRRDYRTIGWLLAGMLPLSLFHAQMETNWPVFLKENIVNYLFVFSLLETIGTIVFICLEVVLVNRTKHISRLHVIQAGYIFYVFAVLGFGFFHHIIAFIVSQLFFCLGAILTLNHMQTFISTLAPSEHKGKYFALFGLHWDISRSTGPLLGGMVLSIFNGHILFLSLALLIVGGAFIQTMAIRSLVPSALRDDHPFDEEVG